MMPPLQELTWPAARIPEALQRLAELSSIPVERAESVPPLPRTANLEGDRSHAWLESAATWLGLDLTVNSVARGDIEQTFSTTSPAIIQTSQSGEPAFLALLPGRRGWVVLLQPDHSLRKIRVDELADRVRGSAAPVGAGIVDRIVDHAGLSGQSATRARAGLINELYGGEIVGRCWEISPGVGAGMMAQARAAGLPRLMAAIIGSHACQSALWIVSWWLLGWMSVRGRFDQGLFWAWIILLMITVPFRMLTEALSGTLGIRAGTLLKRRLLAGICRLESEEVRQSGVGQLLGQVVECEAVETLTVTGGFLTLTATVELVFAAVVLGIGARHWLSVLLLICCVLTAIALGRNCYRRRQDWTTKRLAMTNDLVERMIGHRTRLAQQPRSEWNETEDKSLESYLTSSQEMDQAFTRLIALIPRGWLIVGLIGLMPVFLAGAGSTVSLAVGVGGVVLGYQAMKNLVAGIHRLLGALIAWKRIRFLLEAAGRKQPAGHLFAGVVVEPNGKSDATDVSNGGSLLAVQNLVFRYRPHGRPVLDGVNLSISRGDRLLLEGSSGGGKSTLSSILAGSRLAESGLLMLDGLDRDTLGAEGWRRRIVIAPQFHENHVFMGPLAFNLLMGRAWPASEKDLQTAEAVCRKLGLGPLLERMPGGIHQMVGETGWQLSHGEKSRLYIARALLQQADLTILDESFAALDPHTLKQTLSSVLEQATTLMVVAHP